MPYCGPPVWRVYPDPLCCDPGVWVAMSTYPFQMVARVTFAGLCGKLRALWAWMMMATWSDCHTRSGPRYPFWAMMTRVVCTLI